MKKIFLALMCLSVSVLSSCGKPQATTRESNVDRIFDDIDFFEFRGHQYVRFSKGYGQSRAFGIVHSPDCKCQKKGNYEYGD